MPGPGVYVLAVVGTVAVGYAFYEFVYEPHIAPKLEQWAEEFVARRKARRLQKQGLVPVLQHPESRSSGAKKSHNTSDTESDDDDGWNNQRNGRRSSIELEHLVARELREWRNEAGTSTLRHRKPTRSSDDTSASHSLDESNISIPYSPISPTHVIFDPSEPPTPTSTIGSSVGKSFSRVPSHKPSLSTLRTESPTVNSSSNSDSHVVAPTEVVSSAPGTWVAQQVDLVRRFENAVEFTHGDPKMFDSSSRSSMPFSNISQSSPHVAMSPPNQLNPILTSPVIDVSPISPNPSTGVPSRPSSRADSSVAASPMYQTALSPFMSPMDAQVNISLPASPSPGSPAVFSPSIPSLSFTAQPASSDEGDLISRPTSSMSFISDVQTAYSAPSEISFSHSDNLSSFDDVDEDDVISVGSSSDASPEGRRQ